MLPTRFLCWLPALLLTTFAAIAQAAGAGGAPVLVGLDAEFGNKTSTADNAIRLGIEVAIAEINQAGGVLGGRPLELVVRDNRGVPARGVDNFRELAGIADLTAVLTSKFSPVALAQLEDAHLLRVPLLDPWAAADGIIDHEYSPSYSFRLSLRDGWAMPYLMEQALKRGYRRVGLLLPNGAWGRSSLRAASQYARTHPQPTIARVATYEWSESSLAGEYRELLDAGVEAILVVGNESEVALLTREMTAMPRDLWRPLLCHWGASGGDLPALAGPSLFEADVSVVQSFSFIGNTAPKSRWVLERALARLGIANPAQLPAPVGIAHAYDLLHLLALAIDKAGSTDRIQIRDALEHLGEYQGLVKTYRPAFTPERHEALGPEQLFLARWRRDGALVPVAN